MNEDLRRILWTGGFDSTYLVVDALLTGHRVEAVTYRGNGAPRTWEKAKEEDEARRRITFGLAPEQRRRLQQAEFEESVTYRQMFSAWEEVCATQPGGWSPQWQFLLPLARKIGVPVEAGFVADDPSMKQPAIRALAEREGFVFPLAETSKIEMLYDAQVRGFGHLLTETWSCEGSMQAKLRDPFHTGPCGTCEPCKARIIP